MSDEFHQSFVPSRQADVMDAVADVAGSILGALGYMLTTSRGGPQGLLKNGMVIETLVKKVRRTKPNDNQRQVADSSSKRTFD